MRDLADHLHRLPYWFWSQFLPESSSGLPQLLGIGDATPISPSNTFAEINLPDLGSDNRRVLAVLAWLKGR